jgi:hypothetical protein
MNANADGDPAEHGFFHEQLVAAMRRTRLNGQTVHF